MAWPSCCDAIVSLQNHRVERIRISDTEFCPSHYTSLAPSCSTSAPPKSPTFISFTRFDLTEFLVWCHRVESKECNSWILGEGCKYPSTPNFSSREPSKQNYSSTIHFLRENHLLICWDQEIAIQPFETWFLASPSCFPLQSFSYSSQIHEIVTECWGDYLLKHKSKEFIINNTIYDLLESGVS